MTKRLALPPHHQLYEELAATFDLTRERIDLAHGRSRLSIRTFPFSSAGTLQPQSAAREPNRTFRALVSFFLENNPFSRRNFDHGLDSASVDIEENREFRYAVFTPGTTESEPVARTADTRQEVPGFARATLLLHGLNEKSWNKYLPWAARLAVLTGRPVILFPIAFHMNRAPDAWADPREMMGVARERRRLFPGLEAGSFANAALSQRIQFAPHRFLTSGLETYFNIVDFVREVSSGSHPLFAAGARVDLFGYSIGASLAQLLLMANRDRLFSDSRAFLFCGGAVLDQANPVSRAIMDDEAYRAVFAFLREFASDPTAALPLESDAAESMHRELETIRSMLFLDHRRDAREWLVGSIAPRVRGLVLADDHVFHPGGMIASWRRTDGASLLDVAVGEPAYRYAHEQPFPHRGPDLEAVDRFFDETMERAAAALG
ncbi:MAG: DUF6051 family protein [bacterium]